MTMVAVEFTPLSRVPLHVGIELGWPLHSRPQSFHDCHDLSWFDVEIVLWNLELV